MLAQEWAQPSGGKHEIFPAESDIRNARGEALVTAYALRRPDRRWSLMLINKDPAASARVRVRFTRAGKRADAAFGGPFEQIQFSSREYVWKPNGENGAPERSDPPSQETIAANPVPIFALPPYSLTVIRSAPAP